MFNLEPDIDNNVDNSMSSSIRAAVRSRATTIGGRNGCCITYKYGANNNVYFYSGVETFTRR